MKDFKISEANWQRLFEAALLEQDPRRFAERFQSARDAILDRIEESSDTSLLSERRLLLAALDTIGELERLSPPHTLLRPPVAPHIGHAA
jgi:hypothetical protein